MMRNYVQPGNTITWTNGTGSDVASGDVVVVGSILGIAAVNIANGASGEVATSGVFTAPKTAATVIAQGEGLLFDVSTGLFDGSAAVPAAGDVSGAAVAWEAAGAGVTSVKVRLGHVGTVA